MISLLSTTLIIGSGDTVAETWTDDFPGNDLDSRWVRGGIGNLNVITKGDETYLNPASFTGECDEIWYGPYIRTALPLTGVFDISAVLRCTADTSANNLARVEVRLYDTSDQPVYTFGWADNSMADNKASVYLHEGSQSGVLYSTGPDFIYSIFQEKSIRLVRSNSDITFFIDGDLAITMEPSPKPLGHLEIGFMRYKEYPTYCTPEIIYVNSIDVVTEIPIGPGTPSGLTTTNDNGNANVTWTAPDNGGLSITSYNIFRGTSPGDLQYLTTMGSSTFYLDTSVSVGQRYYYAVQAVNMIGESALSGEGNVVPMTSPGYPMNLQAKAGDHNVDLNWTEPLSDGGSPVIDFNVYRRTSESTAALISSSGDQLYFNDTGLVKDQTYYYSVSAVNAIGVSVTSTEVAITPGAEPTTPSQPRNLQINPGDRDVTLTWIEPLFNGNSPITGYSIYRGNTAGSESLLTTVGNVLSHIDYSLTNDQEYSYRVSAVNALGEGPLPDPVNATPFAITVPSHPREFTGIGGDGEVILNWTTPSFTGGLPITHYNIYRGNSSTNMSLLVSVGDVSTFTDTGLTNGKTYFYRIYAENNIGQGVPSSIVETTPKSAFAAPDTVDSDPGSSTWSWTSSIATFIIFVVAIALMFIYLRKPKEN